MIHVKRTILGIEIRNIQPGMWQITDANVRLDPKWHGKMFQLHGTARLGTKGGRYSVNRWGNPATDTTHATLRSAVRAFRIALGIPGHAFPEENDVGNPHPFKVNEAIKITESIVDELIAEDL